MKLPPIIDAEDVGILAKAAILATLAAGTLVAAAGVTGLAWAVFKLAGGL